MRLHPRYRENLVEHAAMLRGDADTTLEPIVRFQRVDQGKELDGFGARAENGKNAGFAHAQELVANPRATKENQPS